MKKTTFVSIVCIGLISMSASANNLKAELTKCGLVQDSLARLVCFDGLAKTVALSSKSKKQLATSPPIIAKAQLAEKAPVVTSVENKAANFGAEHLKKSDVTEDDLQVIFTIEKLKEIPHNNWRFTFTNGQHWKQTDSSSFSVKEGESVVLKKGFLGAVYLKKNKSNSNKRIRVKRIK